MAEASGHDGTLGSSRTKKSKRKTGVKKPCAANDNADGAGGDGELGNRVSLSVQLEKEREMRRIFGDEVEDVLLRHAERER